MAIKNILVTAIKNNENHHQCRYYFGEGDSQVLFCNAMASGEAGAKKVLSCVNIDEIIAIGSEFQLPKGKTLNRVSLVDGIDYIQADLDSMSDLDFFRYRLMEFIKGVDMEAADIFMSVPTDEQNKMVKDVCDKLGFAPKKLFSHLPRSKKLKEELPGILASYSEAEQEWIKCALYHAMDDRHKFTSRTTNFNLPISFIPVADVCDDDRKNMKNLHQLLSSMTDSADDEIRLYVDIHGFTPEESYIFLSFFFALSDSRHSNIRIESINSLSDIPNGFLYRISDARKRYNVERLLSGMNAFSKYGKADMICDYWKESKINSPSIERMIYAMNSIDVGISLCNIDVLEKGIRMFSSIMNTKEELGSGSEEEMFLMTLKQGIIADYGPLIASPDGNFSYLDLVRWAFNKELYQQTLTIIESRMPLYFVNNGLFYYAKDESSQRDFLAALNAYYWDAAPKDRWCFNDISHFFVKLYGRSVMNLNTDKNANKDQVYLDFRVAQVFDQEKMGALTAYSVIDDRQVFYNLMRAYYDVGNLRNQINHAHLENEMDMSAGGFEQPFKAMVRDSLQKVIDAFTAAEKYVGAKDANVVLISQEEFQAYIQENDPVKNPYYSWVPGFIASSNSKPKRSGKKG